MRIINHDAVDVLAHQIPRASLDEILLLFPDPWPKKRHHKRRIVQMEVVALAAAALRPGGWLRMATDWAEYAEHMRAVMSAGAGFRARARCRRAASADPIRGTRPPPRPRGERSLLPQNLAEEAALDSVDHVLHGHGDEHDAREPAHDVAARDAEHALDGSYGEQQRERDREHERDDRDQRDEHGRMSARLAEEQQQRRERAGARDQWKASGKTEMSSR